MKLSKKASKAYYEQSQGTGSGGKKDDSGKLECNLLIGKFLHGIIKVLMFGAKKYAPQSWQLVPGGDIRYWNALKRHLDAMQNENGEIDLNALDLGEKGSGLPHLWHVQTNAYFLEYFRKQKEKDQHGN